MKTGRPHPKQNNSYHISMVFYEWKISAKEISVINHVSDESDLSKWFYFVSWIYLLSFSSNTTLYKKHAVMWVVWIILRLFVGSATQRSRYMYPLYLWNFWLLYMCFDYLYIKIYCFCFSWNLYDYMYIRQKTVYLLTPNTVFFSFLFYIIISIISLIFPFLEFCF